MVVIKSNKTIFHIIWALLFYLSFSSATHSTVLAEERADVLYHRYEGGGMTIDGPAVLLRKKANESIAFSAYYYVDTISSASVDVMSTASPYSEERKEGQLGIQYLREKTLMSFNIRQSDESDFIAKSLSFSISQDTFGDLTNLSLGLSFGDNDIKRNGDEFFQEESQQYRINATINQILTRNLSLNINVEAVVDEGYLNNPYRTVRYIDNNLPSGVGYQVEVYPRTRNSFSAKLSASYYLSYRAALFFHYRYFNDSWQIKADDFELGYRQPFADSFEFDIKLRYYQQTQASFYRDLFPYQDAQNFLARDKELSDFNDVTLGFGITYQLPQQLTFTNMHSEVSLQWDYIRFDYNNFRDPTIDAAVGEEPLYSFSANVLRLFFSLYF